MKSKEFIIESIKNPFARSKVQDVLYHGTDAEFKKFNRVAHGIYVTPVRSWAEAHYGNTILEIYANVKKLIKLDYNDPEQEDIIDLFYDRDYAALAPILQQWANEGYNCCLFGGESDSMVLFGDIQIANAATGELM